MAIWLGKSLRMNMICRNRLLLTTMAVLMMVGTASAGGLDVHHHWSIEIGKHTLIASEMEDTGSPGIRFTRVQILSRRRIHGRDFQCRLWTFSAIAILVPVGGVVGLAMLLQRRQRKAQ